MLKTVFKKQYTVKRLSNSHKIIQVNFSARILDQIFKSTRNRRQYHLYHYVIYSVFPIIESTLILQCFDERLLIKCTYSIDIHFPINVIK